MEYFIIENNGQQAGPFSLEQLVQKAITPETLVWAQDVYKRQTPHSVRTICAWLPDCRY